MIERKWVSRKQAEKEFPTKKKKSNKYVLTSISDLPKDLKERLSKEWKKYFLNQ